MSGRSASLLERGDLGELAVLLGELGRRRDLDHLGVAERALGEGREPAQRLDLVAEQVDPHGAVLGGREHVEQPAADRELAAVLDLVDALVAGGDESVGRSRRGRAARPLRSMNPCGRSDGSGTFSDSATALTTTTGAPSSPRVVQQRVERRDPQPDEVRRRRQVRLVGDAAARVVADRAAARARPAARRRGRARRGRRRRPRSPARSGRASSSAASRYGRSDCETNARPPSLGQRGGLRVVVGVEKKARSILLSV